MSTNKQRTARVGVAVLLVKLTLSSVPSATAQETWRGLLVEAESRCSPYDKKSQYPYSQNVEDAIIASMDGRVYGPYTGTYFKSKLETDIEHIVAASEGHDSGLCSESLEVRKQFSNDPLNLTLAAPSVNRCGSNGKCGLDAGEWMPERNQCWFANRVVEIKLKYNLSVDKEEARQLESVLVGCDNYDMIYYEQPAAIINVPVEAQQHQLNALSLYDDNNNGRISCSEARKYGIAPVTTTHAAYQYMTDRDGDGVVCE